MTHVVTKITCTDCKKTFSGVLHELFDVSSSYGAECPKCNGMTFFYGVSEFVDTEIPEDAVEVKYVAKL
ncbi:hypothetical protein L9W73_16435 [Vibrio aestuarianus]|uniref:Uncharacterized protein n=1 Tax=Vibrio aestuarianus TaxID=28171 RepID=A0A9X4FHS0_9VIBR|nr:MULTISPECIES: hypothetical protein [Vibrio]MCU8478814.1 hypothetical protein [Vibrio vulnificus]MDE1358872.1 hypothetical protein [Vibrio aestuarianus]WCP81180.1 hypothetical protein PQE20_04070 [Vibrio harveyi]